MAKNNLPVISLIVPTINRGKALARFLESLKKCNITNNPRYELIIVDNSKDPESSKLTKELCQKFGALYLHEDIKGKPAAVNKGIPYAKGKYISETDDDVIITDPEWLERFIKEFEKNPKLGYCSGNVIAVEKESDAQKIWEKNGGLSKGVVKKLWDKKYFNLPIHKVSPWLFHRMCAGANHCIPKEVYRKVGPYNFTLGECGPIGHAYDIEIGYRIARAGYEMLYNPEIYLHHHHPSDEKSLYKKMWTYGKGDSAYPMAVFLEFNDFRYLWWAVLGHPLHTLKKFVLRAFGKYALTPKLIWASFVGSATGSWIYLWYYFTGAGKMYHDYLNKYDYDR